MLELNLGGRDLSLGPADLLDLDDLEELASGLGLPENLEHLS